MTLLITGGSSYLGQTLVPIAEAAGYEVTYTYFSNDPLGQSNGVTLDTRDSSKVMELVDQVRPTGIIHLAGSNRNDDMSAVIEQGAENMVLAADRLKIPLVHMSTDVLFDGTKAPYVESDQPDPLHRYGAAKAAAERTISAYFRHKIVRTSLIYGLDRMDRGTEWVQASLSAGKPVTLFTDQMRNPVWADALAQACLELVEHEFTGIIHVAGAERISRADYGTGLLDWWGVEYEGRLSRAPQPVDASWPIDTTLSIELAQTLLKTELLGVTDQIERHKNSR